MNGLDGHLWDKSVRSIFWNSDGRVCDAAGVRTLEEAFKKAYSIENMAGHNADDQETEYIGTVQRGKRLYQIHKGKEEITGIG